MDLIKSGENFKYLRKLKDMTQKEVANNLGISAKTVSKWETGHGFPDIDCILELSKLYNVTVETLLLCNLNVNKKCNGNIKHTKFYICPDCHSIIQGTGDFDVICCGKILKSQAVKNVDEDHNFNICEIENDYFITFNHQMTKEHYISFVSYISYDKILTIKMYPEQDATVRFPKLHGGKFYFYCNKHGLFSANRK